jgi:LPS export ABC transporter protein LptC
MTPSAPKLVAAVALGLTLASASSPSPSPAASAGPTSEPVHIESNSNGDEYVTIVHRVNAGTGKGTRIAYQLRALSNQADIVGGETIATFAQPHITFYDRRGKTLIADSPQAKIQQQDKSVLMSGGVHARAEDGSVLTCDTLRYDGDTERLHGQGHVVLSGPSDLTLTGDDLDGDVRLDDVRVSQRP